ARAQPGALRGGGGVVAPARIRRVLGRRRRRGVARGRASVGEGRRPHGLTGSDRVEPFRGQYRPPSFVWSHDTVLSRSTSISTRLRPIARTPSRVASPSTGPK